MTKTVYIGMDVHSTNYTLSSAVLYSLAETSRANGLRSYEYFSYLLTELPKYIHDFETEIPESLFPWSEDFPKELFR